jgi:hypothetical protein
MKLPVIKAFSETFAFVFGNYLDILKIILVPVAALAGLGYWLNSKMMPLQAQMLQIDPHADPMGRLQAMAPMFRWLGILFLAALILYPMIYAGLLRFAIRGQKPGFIYLRFAGDEFRLLLTFILMMLLFLAIAIGGGIVIAIAGVALGAVSKQAAGIAVLVTCLVLVIVLIWIALRLSLSYAAAVGAEGIGIGPSWSATKGAAWALFFYWLLWAVLIAIVGGVFFSLLLPDYFAGMSDLIQTARMHPGDPQAAREAANQWQARNLEVMQAKLPVIVAGGFLYGIIIRPLLVVASGVAYRLLTEGSAAEAHA